MLSHTAGSTESVADKYQSAAHNLHQNYAYEKLRDRRLMEYAISPLANTPPAEHLMHPGVGFGYMRVAASTQIVANGLEIESYLRGAGTKALEGRSDFGIEAYTRPDAGYTALRDPEQVLGLGGGRGRSRSDASDASDDDDGGNMMLSRTWVRSSGGSAAAAPDRQLAPAPNPNPKREEEGFTFRPRATAESDGSCTIA